MDRMMNSKFLYMILDITHSFKRLHITAVNLNTMQTCLEQLTDWQVDQLTQQLIHLIQFNFYFYNILLNHYKYLRTTTNRKVWIKEYRHAWLVRKTRSRTEKIYWMYCQAYHNIRNELHFVFFLFWLQSVSDW